MTRSVACGALLTILLSACAGLAPQAPPPYGAPFDLLGRVVVRYDGRAFSSGVRWLHESGRDEIWLMSPAGQTIAHINSSDDGAVLTAADRQQFRAANVESLTRQALGWELPLTRLQYWARGEVAPGPPPEAAQRDGAQRLTALDQAGWRITIDRYPIDQHGGLPRRLDLANGSHEIRFVIDNWRGLLPGP